MAGWLTLAAAAPAAGVAAIGALESGITEAQGVRPLDREAVERALNGSRATPASSSGAPAPATPAAATPGPDAGRTRVLRAGGGTLTARCGTGGATLLAWSPAQGYRAGHLVRGPAAAASLTFESEAREYEVTVTCEAGGGPVAHTAEDDGHHRRGRHD